MADALTPLTYSLADLLAIGYQLMGYYLWREWRTYYHRAFSSSMSMNMPLLRRVWQLRACLQHGLISEAEFNRQKAELLHTEPFFNVGLNSAPVVTLPIGLRLLLWLVS